MSSAIVESRAPNCQVVDLREVKPFELDALWQREVSLWRDRLYWDVSGALASLRRALERGGMRGKAVRVGSRTVGYAYYMLEAERCVVSGLVVAPDWASSGVGSLLLRETVDEIWQTGVRRIESQFVSIEPGWLTESFESAGFRTYWREFMRIRLGDSHYAAPDGVAVSRGREPRPLAPASSKAVRLERWRASHAGLAAAIMRRSHHAGVDAQMNELYRTEEGCRVLLDNILSQRGCGAPISDASAFARCRGEGVGFSIVTEIARGQGHLAQVAVLPAFQGQGLGRQLMGFNLAGLRARGFETLSLMVSRENETARSIYRRLGFRTVLQFPVFSWEA